MKCRRCKKDKPKTAYNHWRRVCKECVKEEGREYNLIQEYEELKKAIESAGNELPEKRELEKDSFYLQYDKGFNHALGSCQPILAKYLLKIKELENELDKTSKK